MQKNQAKVEWLRSVFAKKNVLFGAFSDRLTKTDKINAWKEVHILAQALGLVPPEKEHTYTRDVLWQNLKKSAMKKKDNANQTGSGGGTEYKISPIDNMVYDIIGRNTPVMEGLDVQESINKENTSPQCSKPLKKKYEKRSPKNMSTREFEELNAKRVKLTIECLEKEKYYKELKIKKLEQELGVTSCLHSVNLPECSAVETLGTSTNAEYIELEFLDSSSNED